MHITWTTYIPLPSIAVAISNVIARVPQSPQQSFHYVWNIYENKISPTKARCKSEYIVAYMTQVNRNNNWGGNQNIIKCTFFSASLIELYHHDWHF